LFSLTILLLLLLLLLPLNDDAAYTVRPLPLMRRRE
jgi:hypothetical protein